MAQALVSVVGGSPDPAEVFAALILERPSWHADAACKEARHLPWTAPPRRNVDTAPALALMRAVCGGCLVRDECAQAAVGEVGYWAGRVRMSGEPAWWAADLDEAAMRRSERPEYDDVVDLRIGPRDERVPLVAGERRKRERERARARRPPSPTSRRPCSTDGCPHPTRSPTGLCGRCRRRAKRQLVA